MAKEKSENNNYGLYIAIVAVIMIVGIGYYMNQKFNTQGAEIAKLNMQYNHYGQLLTDMQNNHENHINGTDAQIENLKKSVEKTKKRLNILERNLKSKRKTTQIDNDDISSDESDDDPIISRRARR